MKRIKEIEHNWHEFGQSDPYWSVLTDPRFINNKWDVDAFYKSGEHSFNKIKSDFAGLLRDHYDTAIDFGCGPGRVTFQIAKIAGKVIGIDISASMIRLANERNIDQEKCQFVVNKKANLKFLPSDSVDLVFSYITLQHNPPEIIIQYLNEFIRVSKNNGGHILFNLVSSPPLRYKALHYLLGQKTLNRLRKYRYKKKSAMEMNWIDKQKIIRHFNENNFTLLKMVREESAGKNWESYFYLFKNNAHNE